MSNALAAIRSLDELQRYLCEELHWPIRGLTLDDITFEFDPIVDLGLDVAPATRIGRLLRLRPLAAGQPFSVVFVEFASVHLPTAVLRRVLCALVTRRSRATVDPALRPLDRESLLFVSTCGDPATGRRVDFAHFVDRPDGSTPDLKLLGWRSTEPPEKLADVERRVRTAFRWPDDSDWEGWRRRWRETFTARPPATRGAWIDLDDASRRCLADLYAAAERTVDALPYTDDFEWIRRNFNERTGHRLSPFEFWRALTAARKSGSLTRKERELPS